jgi:adenylate kinase
MFDLCLESLMNNELIPPFKEKFKAIILFGPPGSGKGTLGKLLAAAGNHYHLSSGELFRGLDPDSPVGKIYHNYASQGHLVPDDVTVQIWHHYVNGLIATNCYFPRTQLLLLDGIPRTRKQAEILDSYLECVQIIVLDIKNIEELKRRISKRGTIEERPDDKSLAILQTRMQVYDQETVQLLQHYPRALISHFNADQRPLEVLRDVLNKLTPLLSRRS